MINQNKTDNRLFVLSFENEDDRRSYFKYYTPTNEITDSNAFLMFQ